MAPSTATAARVTTTIKDVDNFEKAKASFLADVKEKHRADAKEWLRSQDSAQEAQTICKTLSDESEAKYSSKGSVTLAGHNVFPKKVITKLLDNIDTFVSVGDFAIKGGPESAGLVWMGVKMVLGSVQQDYKNCLMFADCFTDIVGIFVSCRLYSKLYHGSKGDIEVSNRMHTDIQKMYVDILEYSFAVKRHFHHGRAVRVGKGLIPGITYDFEGKQKLIKAHNEKMIGSARDSFQEMSTNFYEEWRGSQAEAREAMHALQMGMQFMQRMMNEIAEERRYQKEKES